MAKWSISECTHYSSWYSINVWGKTFTCQSMLISTQLIFLAVSKYSTGGRDIVLPSYKAAISALFRIRTNPCWQNFIRRKTYGRFGRISVLSICRRAIAFDLWIASLNTFRALWRWLLASGRLYKKADSWIGRNIAYNCASEGGDAVTSPRPLAQEFQSWPSPFRGRYR